MGYARAYEMQATELEAVLAARESGSPRVGTLMLLEHDPVVTVSRRATAAGNVLGSPEFMRARGVEVHETDRGGDVTYHGPGQLVGYAILDLNLLKLGLHDYMRMLEQSVIDAVAGFGVAGTRDATATGVWVERGEQPAAKLCAFGVRVKRWVSMHGLGLNVDPDMSHFGLIVPCGLTRPVTSLKGLLGAKCPSMDEVKGAVAGSLSTLVRERMEKLKSQNSNVQI